LIENEAYQNAIAAGLIDAIAKYRLAVGKNPSAPPQR
jgi:hypothetical protein